MANVSYLPNIAPPNNNTQQIRRRVNQTTQSVVDNSTDIASIQQTLPTLAPLASPTFTGAVTQETPSALTNATTATSATAGAATALPSAPLGYLTMTLNGVQVKLPYYNV
jgi:hypothetical protein